MSGTYARTSPVAGS